MRTLGEILEDNEDLGEVLDNDEDLGEILHNDEDLGEILEQKPSDDILDNEETLDLVLGRGGHNLKRLNMGDSSHDPTNSS